MYLQWSLQSGWQTNTWNSIDWTASSSNRFWYWYNIPYSIVNFTSMFYALYNMYMYITLIVTAMYSYVSSTTVLGCMSTYSIINVCSSLYYRGVYKIYVDKGVQWVVEVHLLCLADSVRLVIILSRSLGENVWNI